MKKLYTLSLLFTVLLIISACSNKDTLHHEYEAENIILIIGDGMGTIHEEVAREILGGPLAWDDFPFQGEMVTTSLSYPSATGSDAAATAMSTGVKTRNTYLGKDADGLPLKHFYSYAMEVGMRTGMVVTDNLYGATPAGFSVSDAMRFETRKIRTEQLKSGMDVLIGADPSEDYQSHMDLIEEYGYYYTQSIEEDINSDKLLLLPYTIDAPENFLEYSTLFLPLVDIALNTLTNNHDDGFFLLIEGAKIDHFSHSNNYDFVYELIDMHYVVQYVMEWVEDNPNTIVIVTADHETGGLSIDSDDTSIPIKDRLAWSTGGHTNDNVNYYLYADSCLLCVEVIDITDIHFIMRSYLPRKPKD